MKNLNFFNFYKVKLAFIVNCRTDGKEIISISYVLVMGIFTCMFGVCQVSLQAVLTAGVFRTLAFRCSQQWEGDVDGSGLRLE